jgi:hypothetical protein
VTALLARRLEIRALKTERITTKKNNPAALLAE